MLGDADSPCNRQVKFRSPEYHKPFLAHPCGDRDDDQVSLPQVSETGRCKRHSRRSAGEVSRLRHGDRRTHPRCEKERHLLQRQSNRSGLRPPHRQLSNSRDRPLPNPRRWGWIPTCCRWSTDMQASAPVKPLPNLAQKPTATPFKLPKLDGDWWLILKNLPPELIGLAVIVFVSLLMLIFGNIVTKVFFLLVALAAVNGYLLGASKVASALAGLLIAAFLGVPLGKAFEGLIGGMFGTTGLTNRMISVVVVTVVLVAIVGIALQFVLRRFLAEKPEWQRYDRQAGLGIGLAEGLLLGLVMIWAVLSLDPVAQTSIAQAEENNLPVNPVAKMVGHVGGHRPRQHGRQHCSSGQSAGRNAVVRVVSKRAYRAE